MGEKDQHREMGLGKPMRIHEVAHRTWPECYSVGYRRDIVRQDFRNEPTVTCMMNHSYAPPSNLMFFLAHAPNLALHTFSAWTYP